MSKLTVKQIEHAAPKAKEYRLSDGNGLILRIRPSGAKSWLYCFRLPCNRTLQQMTLGSFDDVSLKDARSLLPALKKQISQGIDPRTVRAAVIAENTQAISMQGLFDVWIEYVKLTKEVTPKWMKQHETRWARHLKAPLGKLLAKDITRAHLASVLDGMSRKGIKEETRKSLSTLNLMLDYGLTRHLIEQNPARLLKPKDFAASANRPRDRALSLLELRRSAATCWGEHLKTSPHVIERMLNHQPLNKLIATYQRAVYADEQKAAWLAWGKMVEEKIAREPTNIIPFKRTING